MLFVLISNGELQYANPLKDTGKTDLDTPFTLEDLNKTRMKNYRPISPLNVDYKIISKAITNKLQPHMSNLKHADQQCSIAGRKI